MRMKTLAFATFFVAVFAGSFFMPTFAENDRIFVTHLSGDEEVPPVDTKAQGQAIFMLSKDGTELRFILIAAKLENITMSHIHMAPKGQNGPIVAWLYPSVPPPVLIPGAFNGVLASGAITAADLVGPLEGMSLSALLTEMMSGNTYVNIHTQQNPGGEIRGQL
jgi:hypothetical protein